MQCHHNGTTALNFNLYYEVLIRIITFLTHWWFNGMGPFIRQIQPNELWLYQYPPTPSYVSPTNLWLIVLILPAIILYIDYMLNRNKDDIIRAVLALTLGYPLTCALTTIIKVMVGRPRPDFYYRCFPDGNGTDFNKCTGDWKSVDDGRKSFPSGHSSLSFCFSIFVAMYLIKKFQLSSSTTSGKSWKLCVIMLPILLSTAIAISRTCDYHHHYQDVIAGSILGAIVSYILFKLYFNDVTTTNCNCKNIQK